MDTKFMSEGNVKINRNPEVVKMMGVVSSAKHRQRMCILPWIMSVIWLPGNGYAKSCNPCNGWGGELEKSMARIGIK